MDAKLQFFYRTLGTNGLLGIHGRMIEAAKNPAWLLPFNHDVASENARLLAFIEAELQMRGAL